MQLFKKRVVLLIILSIVLLSFVVRYPLVEHERHQTDSYYVHMLASSIVEDDYASWVFHPLSLLGLYPYSYPSGVPFLLAQTSDVTGLNVEASILAFNMIISVLFCFSVFILAREFTTRLDVVLLAVVLAILGARFVDTTYWDGSARGPLVVLATLALSLFFRADSRNQNRIMAVALVIAASCFAIHHMAVLILLFGVAYVAAAYQKRHLLIRMNEDRRGIVALASSFVILAVVVLVGFGVWSYFGELAMRNLGATPLADFDPIVLSLIVNSAAIYTKQIGFILVLAVIGAPYLIMKRPNDCRILFLVAVLIVFIPLLGNSLYISMVLTPFVAILGSRFMVSFLSARTEVRRSLTSVVVVMLVSSSAALTVWSTTGWTEHTYEAGATVRVDDSRFNDASYLLWQHVDVYAISNSNHAQLQYAALSDARFLDSGIYLVLCGDIGAREMNNNVTSSDVGFPRNVVVWLEYEDAQNVNIYVYEFMMWGMRVVNGENPNLLISEYLSWHGNLLVVVDNALDGQYANPYFIQNPLLLQELKDASWSSPTADTDQAVDSYVSYSSSGSTLYLLGL